MRTPQTRHPHASEADNRLDWWLRELGQPPTYEAVIAMRPHRRHTHRWNNTPH